MSHVFPKSPRILLLVPLVLAACSGSPQGHTPNPPPEDSSLLYRDWGSDSVRERDTTVYPHDGSTADTDAADRDGDGVPDTLDICPDVPDPAQVDTDNDGIGDACDDDDHDHVLDIHDNCLGIPNSDQKDTNGDGLGDACAGLRRNERAIQQILTTPLHYPYRVVFIGDVRTPGEQIFADLRQQITQLNPQPLFVAVVGDLVRHGTPAEYDQYEAAIDNFPLPIINVIGNHELYDKAGIWEYMDRFGSTDDSFDYGKSRFVWCNNAIPIKDKPYELTSQQSVWLESTLAIPTVKDRFVIMHVPPKTRRLPKPGDIAYGGHFFDGNDGFTGAPDMMRMIERYDTTIGIFAHVHIYGNYVANRTRYLITGGGGAEVSSVKATAPWHDGKGLYHFVVVDIRSPKGHDYSGYVVAHGDGTKHLPNFDFSAQTGAKPVLKPLPFTDNFSTQDLAAWETRIHYGPSSHELATWTVASGRLEQNGNFYSSGGASAEGTYLCTWDRSWRDVTFTVTLGNTDNDSIGVLFRYQDDDNYYRFSMNSEGNFRRLVRKLKGKFTTLYEDKGGYTPGLSYTLQVRAVGSALSLHINGKEWTSVKDTSFPRGGVGLYVRASQGAWFDNVSVVAAQ